MSLLTVTGTTIGALDEASSRITDIAIFNGTLFSTTRFDGQIVQWSLTDLSEDQSKDYQGTQTAGASPQLAIVSGKLLASGWYDNSFALHDTDLGSTLDLNTTVSLKSFTTFELASTTFVYGGTTGGGLGYFEISASNTASAPTTVTSTDQVDVQTVGNINGAPFLFTASNSTNQIWSWTIAADGTPTQAHNIGVEDGFWAANPTALATLELGGETYLIVAAAGSSSLTTLRVSADGSMEITDHLLDDRLSRFAGATTLEAISHNGQTYVVVGGADDGITVLQLMPNGRLYTRASIDDTPEAALSNPSAIALKSETNGISIFVASSSEVGLTELFFDTSGAGSVLNGTGGNDVLVGTSQDDILLDGAGSDTLSGGDGNDYFVLAQDGEQDEITDFDLGHDVVDLSGWAGLRSSAQLYLTPTSNGIRITYGDEILDVTSKDGEALSAKEFAELGLEISTRLSTDPTPGFSGPETDNPDLPDRDIYVAPTQDIENDDAGIERVGVASAEALTGTDFADHIWGQGGDDTISGRKGDDMLFGGSGSDTLLGEDGNDHLSGGKGRETTWQLAPSQASNKDTLFGGNGDDHLLGLAGSDFLDGGAGDDILTGGGGRDTFVFSSGTDRITDFRIGIDRLELATGLWTGNKSAAEVVQTYARKDGANLILDFGADVLIFEELADTDNLPSQIDLN